MQTIKNIVWLLTFICAVPMYPGEVEPHEMTKQQAELLWQELQNKQRQYDHDRMVYEAKAEMRSVASGLIMVPITCFFGSGGLFTAIIAGMATSEKLLEITGSQDFSTNVGIGVGCLIGAAVLYGIYCISKDVYDASGKMFGE